ncbi:MAG: glutamate racemase [Pseudomonadota bacterium]
MNANLPIGVFDSGLGGLTVVHQLRRVLPDESIIYLGDTARVPYGTRSPATVIRYARGCSKLLIDRGIKVLVVACNTVSAVALDILRAELDLPVLGVVGPGARAAVAAAEEMEARLGHPVRIGVMGTASTIASGAYPREVSRLSTRAEVCAQPAPLLVPLVEEGWLEGEVPRLAVERYVRVLTDQGARVLVLGCTHYPLLKPIIAEVAAQLAGEEVVIVDSAEATAHTTAELLRSRGLVSTSKLGKLELLVTDMPTAFSASAGRFLGEAVDEAVQVDITPY